MATLKKPGIYGDGAGLYFRVKSETARSWVFIWTQDGRRRETGLGAPPMVSLARARERAQQVRETIADGNDPVAIRRSKRQIPTFGEAADAFIAERRNSVRSDKSIARWERAIGKGNFNPEARGRKGNDSCYAERLRPMRIDQITTADVLAVVRPLWETKPPSAKLLRGYIEAVLDVAKVEGHRTGDNPAKWDGHLEVILPKSQKLQQGHHAAMPFLEVPAFMQSLSSHLVTPARALEFTILTAARTSETLLAEWGEFDLDEAVWTIPAGRMKVAKEHRVPLSGKALQLLEDLPRASKHVFPGQKAGKPLSQMAMQMLMRRTKRDYTVHGFRSSFRDWAGEATDTPREVAEAALAHTVGNSAELAYRRGDALEKRRALMELWATFCMGGEIDTPDTDRPEDVEAQSAVVAS